MTETIIQAVVLFLPAGVANMVPVLIAKMPVLKKWNAPIDGGRTFRGIPILGSHKTWRGLLVGTSAGALFGWGLFCVINASWEPTQPLAFAAAISFGALFGDSVKSFFKRQIGVTSGKSWFPFDQTDYIIGGVLLTLPLYSYSFALVSTIFLVYFGLHLAISYLGYLLHFKKDPI